MTKNEMDELGTMAMKVINNVELTDEEELRFVELSAKLEELDATPVGTVLEGSADGAPKSGGNRSDVSSPVLEGNGD